jgi:hypothetical protein
MRPLPLSRVGDGRDTFSFDERALAKRVLGD